MPYKRFSLTRLYISGHPFLRGFCRRPTFSTATGIHATFARNPRRPPRNLRERDLSTVTEAGAQTAGFSNSALLRVKEFPHGWGGGGVSGELGYAETFEHEAEHALMLVEAN